MNTDIFAVVWTDFVPLSLFCEDEKAAIEAAKGMHAKAHQNRVAIHHLRAVRLDGANNLKTLWKPEG